MSGVRVVAVTGRPGSGKTTLAAALAERLGWPLVARDTIKHAMVWNADGYRPGPGDPYALRTLETMAAVLAAYTGAGVSVVAEAAYQEKLWRRALEGCAGRAEVRVVRCTVAPETAVQRMRERIEAEPGRLRAHTDAQYLAELPDFTPVDLGVPALDVDTGSGYRPGLDAVASFSTGR
ncbi:AAA family ATPase [Streptomyces sp. NPDC090077]|uniref:AAA family ATPase n=1 Tax=Streptomyces sp. NPDC090077 TaxID=3365938 RepID=UPI00381E3663